MAQEKEYRTKKGPSKWSLLLDSWYEGKPVYYDLEEGSLQVGAEWLSRIYLRITTLTRHLDKIPGTEANFWLFIAKLMYPGGTYDDSGIRVTGSYNPYDRIGHFRFLGENCPNCSSFLVIHGSGRFFCGNCKKYFKEKEVAKVSLAVCPNCYRIAKVKHGLIECDGCTYLQHHLGQTFLDFQTMTVGQFLCRNCMKPIDNGYGTKCIHCSKVQE